MATCDISLYNISFELWNLLQLEKQVVEVEQYYESAGNAQGNCSKGGSVVKEKSREKNLVGTKKPLQDALRTETAAAKRMQELMRQFSTILRQASVDTLQFFFYLMIYMNVLVAEKGRLGF